MELQAKKRLQAKPQASAQEAADAIQKIFDTGGLDLKVVVEDDTTLMCSGKTKLGKVVFTISLDRSSKGAKSVLFDFLVQDGTSIDDARSTYNDTPWGVTPKDIKDVDRTWQAIDELAADFAKSCEIVSSFWRQFGLAMKKINQLTETHK